MAEVHWQWAETGDDFLAWVGQTFTRDIPHAVLPGHRVRIDAIPCPHVLSAGQARALALHLLALSLPGGEDSKARVAPRCPVEGGRPETVDFDS
jgi:hypothetical protein